MKLSQNAILFAALAGSASAFSPQHATLRQQSFVAANRPSSLRPSTLRMASSTSQQEGKVDEIERLRAMAAKLRAEASSLESEQKQAMASAAEKAFRKFDSNQDGEVSVEELKAGLEKTFKLQQELSQDQVQQLMENFDKSGDGALQMDEFVSVEQFRNRLDALAREERALAKEKARVAQAERALAQRLDDQLAVINDQPPTATDKLVSVLPYLLPLLDGLQYARFFVLENPNNVLATAAGILYTLYQSIPLGGFLAFLSLAILSGNLRINRLIRFNMQQAIFVDIALIVPGLLAALVSLTGAAVPPEMVELGYNTVFAGLLVTTAYTVGSSLLGQTPDKIPFLSDAVKSRVPTVEEIKMSTEAFFPGIIVKSKSEESSEDDDEKVQKD